VVASSPASSATGPGGEQLDDLVAQQRRVDVHDDEPHGATVQATALHGHVDAERGRLPGQRGSQAHRICAGDVELEAGHWPVREPGDPLNVRAAGRDPARDGRDSRRLQRPA
jgi:hypothetical protein